MRSLRRASLLLIAPALAAACSQPADPGAVRERINRDLPDLIDQSASATRAGDLSTVAFGHALDTLDRLAPGVLPDVGSTGLAFSADGDGPARTGAEVARDVNDTLFTDASYDGDGVFRVSAEAVCPIDDATGAIDPGCASRVDAAQLQIKAELVDADGLDLAVQVGADHATPLTLELRRHSVTASLDLGEAAAAMTELASIVDQPDLAFELAGVLTARLDVLGTAHVAAAVTIDQPIHVAYAGRGGDLAGPDAFRFDTAVAHPLVRVELDGDAVAGSAQVGLGSTRAHLPADVDPALDLDLPGITGTMTIAAGQSLQLSRISLGDRTTTVSVGGQPAISIDLDRDSGRAFDATLAGDDTDATFTVSPALDLRIAIDHAVLGDGTPRYDVTRVVLDGAPAPSLRASMTTDGTAQVEVMSGQLAVETNPAGYGVALGAGQCAAEQLRSDAQGDYAMFIAAACEP